MRFVLCVLAYFGLIVIGSLSLDTSHLPWWRVTIGIAAYGLAFHVYRMPWRRIP